MKRPYSLCILMGLILFVAGVVWHQGNPMAKRSSSAINPLNIGATSSPCAQTPLSTSGRARDSVVYPRQTGCDGLVGAIATASAKPKSSASEIQCLAKDVMAITDPIHQSEAIETLVASISSAEIPVWANVLADLSVSGSISEIRERIVRRWAEECPDDAATWAGKQSVPLVRQEALTQVAFAWAESDLAKAVEWAANLPADEVQAVILVNLGYELARKEPVEALALAGTLLPVQDRDDLTLHAVSQWANTDALAATDWAHTIPGLALRERVLASIAMAMADQNPEAAVILTTQALWPGESQKQAAIAIVQRWSQQDPQGAASWVQQFPAGDLQETAVRNLIAVWSQGGSGKPVEWLNSLPEGTMRSIGADALAGVVNSYN